MLYKCFLTVKLETGNVYFKQNQLLLNLTGQIIVH